MTERLAVRKGTYLDSVSLMLASRDAEALDGVTFVAAVSATPVNVELLTGQGFDVPADLGPNDLVVAIKAADDGAADAAAALVEDRLRARPEAAAGSPTAEAPRSFRAARTIDQGLNLAFVSVPGRHAALEVAQAIEAGLNVFCFSDGIDLETEAALKRRAVEDGLLLMGADCGTAIIDGIAFGFANVVRRGSVAIVAASGTGLQQVTCLLDSAGVGVSQAIGVGGRDLSATVGGTMTLHALDMLADDPDTETIVVISKPPAPEVARAVVEAAGRVGKRVVLGLLGLGERFDAPRNVEVTTSLEDAAVAASPHRIDTTDAAPPERTTPGRIRGLFAGGTLCEETRGVVAAAGAQHEFTDFGADQWTAGRPHPMIDPGVRNEHFERAAGDRGVGVIVVDVVLGFGAHPDPAGDLGPLVEHALDRRDDLTIIATLCGTERDPQGLDDQRRGLRAAGAIVTRNAAHAGRLALAAGGA